MWIYKFIILLLSINMFWQFNHKNEEVVKDTVISYDYGNEEEPEEEEEDEELAA